MRYDQIARVAHEINRAYCEALGDTSQLPWEQAPEWQRESALNGVFFHANNPHVGPEASHESWLKEKVVAGWVYGPVKDAEAKTHPCIVPFEQLPREQQAKDFLFREVVHVLMAVSLETTGTELIREERQRQIEEKGWTAEHDAAHSDGELAQAAVSYAADAEEYPEGTPPPWWPWGAEWWKPSDDMIRNLTKAGALIAAEIDRLRRIEGSPSGVAQIHDPST